MKITHINPDSAIVQQKLVLVRSRGMEIRADQTQVYYVPIRATRLCVATKLSFDIRLSGMLLVEFISRQFFLSNTLSNSIAILLQ